MTTKEAAERSNKTVAQIRQAIHDKFLEGAIQNGKYVIPDDTPIIIIKQEVQAFLLQILKFKNNEYTVISRSLCPELEKLRVLSEYLYKKGFIGYVGRFDTEKEFFSKAQLTDEGFALATENAVVKTKDNKLSFNPSININFSLVHT